MRVQEGFLQSNREVFRSGKRGFSRFKAQNAGDLGRRRLFAT